MTNEDMILILKTISDKLEVNELGYDEEYETIKYCIRLLENALNYSMLSEVQNEKDTNTI